MLERLAAENRGGGRLPSFTKLPKPQFLLRLFLLKPNVARLNVARRSAVGVVRLLLPLAFTILERFGLALYHCFISPACGLTQELDNL